MKNKEYMSILEVAELLGISRQAVHKKIKKGEIEAIRIGRNYAVPTLKLISKIHKTLQDEDKKQIRNIVGRVVREYGEVLRLLGNE